VSLLPLRRVPCLEIEWRLVKSHEKRRCHNLGPTQSRISPSILLYTEMNDEVILDGAYLIAHFESLFS